MKERKIMKSFTIYEEYYDLITLLPSEEEQGKTLLAIAKYMFEDKEMELSDKQKKVFNNLKRPLNIQKNNSKRGTKKKTENETENETGDGTGRVTGDGTGRVTGKVTHQDGNVYVNVNDNVNNLEKIGCGEEKPLREIVDYLNQKTGSHFRYSGKTTQMKINARLNEGYKLDDFIAVIDKKYAEWVGTEFERYLEPETLFGPKFEKYLNQKVTKQKNEKFEVSREQQEVLDYDWLNEKEK